MSNIAVIPCLQKQWALTSALDSAGTSYCPGLIFNTASPFTVRSLPPPPWASLTMSTPTLAVPLYCRAPAPVIPPFNVLLLI